MDKEHYTPAQIELVAWRVKQNAGMTAAERDLAFHAIMDMAKRVAIGEQGEEEK